MRNKRKINAFTLVELLIVIALIGILSVAVLATINPIEQANKARDAKFKNDVAEVLGALERYYASQNNYPWNSVGHGVLAGDTSPAGSALTIGSSEARFGVVVGGVGGTPSGALVSTSELKSSFGGKEMFTSEEAVNRTYIYHNGVDDNYVCFHPKSRANRNLTDQLKCLTAVGAGTLLNAGDANCDDQDPGASDWASGVGTSANLMCVPEGDIQ